MPRKRRDTGRRRGMTLSEFLSQINWDIFSWRDRDSMKRATEQVESLGRQAAAEAGQYDDKGPTSDDPWNTSSARRR